MLAAVLHDVLGARLLRRMHSAARLLDAVLAGLLQFGPQSARVRAVRQRLSVGVSRADLPLPVSAVVTVQSLRVDACVRMAETIRDHYLYITVYILTIYMHITDDSASVRPN